MNPKKKYYQKKAENIIKNFEKRNIEGFYFATAAEAVEKILEIIEEDSSVSWGGSMTLEEIGVFEKLENRNLELLDRAKAKNLTEKENIYHRALSADYYLMSSNAITQSGKLVNIDGRGNRAAALIYGPKNVIIAAGMNKVVIDEETALKRVKNQAAPANVTRLNKNTPCLETGRCHECQVDDTICCQTVITRRSGSKNRIKVILIGEELGY
jgi:hypothetical protein